MPIPNPDTHASPPVAGAIVYRHACHCSNANRPPAPEEEVEHRFDVDGEPFPWYITEAGARFTKQGEAYLVEVDIIPIEAGGNHDLLDITISYWRRQPRIGDRAFPWAILDGSIRVDVLDGSFPVLHLVFLANEVDTDGDVAVGAEVIEDEPEEPFTLAELDAKMTDWEHRNAEALDVDAGYQRYLDRLAGGATAGDCGA